VAGVPWLAEFAAQSVCSRELRGLFVWRTASELCALRSRGGASHCGLRELVPQVQRGLDNGRALQDLLHQAAPRYIKALKRERAESKKSDEG
jgi:hypothetical protein